MIVDESFDEVTRDRLEELYLELETENNRLIDRIEKLEKENRKLADRVQKLQAELSEYEPYKP